MVNARLITASSNEQFVINWNCPDLTKCGGNLVVKELYKPLPRRNKFASRNIARNMLWCCTEGDRN